MDPEAFLEISNQFAKLNMYPYFEIAYCIINLLYLKEDIAGAHPFSRKHPLACWCSAMLSIFGGAMAASFLLGEPIVSALKNNNSLLIATGAWYIIFYLPFDIGYKVFHFLPVKLVLAIMKEVMRCKKVFDGVSHASAIYPNSYLIMIMVGTLKGNGAAFIKILERLVRGVWTPNANEIMSMSFPTKSCIAASIIFVLDMKTDLIAAPHNLVYFGVAIFFVYFKLSSMLLGIHDPIAPFENLFCSLFLGGVVDTVQRLLTPASKGDQTTVKAEPAKNGKADSAKKKE